MTFDGSALSVSDVGMPIRNKERSCERRGISRMSPLSHFGQPPIDPIGLGYRRRLLL